MAKTPTKLEILQKINEIVNAVNGQTVQYEALLAKLDLDLGVQDTNYKTTVNIEPFSAEDLAAFDQLINLRE